MNAFPRDLYDSMELTPGQTRVLILRLGFSPRQDLGQNFLIDGNIVAKSIELADLQPGETVIEIGPGLGVLTQALLRLGATVHAIEIDPKLCRFLEETFLPSFSERLFLRRGDAVKDPLAGLAPRTDDPFSIVANLPYAISTPWLDAVLGRPLPRRMVLMLQKETASRFSAQPGTKNFGAISIFAQSAYTIKRGHKVSRHCFYPSPAVDSVLLTFARKEEAFSFDLSKKSLIRSIFNHRRKQIGTIARNHPTLRPWLDILVRAGVSLKTRPESIPLELWQALDRVS